METMPTTSQDPRREVVVRMPAGWSRALVTGCVGALVPWLILLVLGGITAHTQSGNPWLVEASLADEVAAISRVWAGGYCVPLAVVSGAKTVTITLVPWGLTLAYWWVYSRIIGRRCRGWALWFAVPTYVLTALAIGAAFPGIAVGRLTLVSFIVGIAGVLSALARRHSQDRRPRDGKANKLKVFGVTSAREADRASLAIGIDAGEARIGLGARTLTVPGWVGMGLTIARRILVGLALMGIALTAVSLLVSIDRVEGVRELLPLDGWGTLMLWLGQLAYLPTLAAWSFAWVLGPGYTLGTGTHFSAFEATSGPIPAIPVLAGAPQVTVGWWAIGATVVVAVIVGLGIGTVYARDKVSTHCLQMLVAHVVAALGVAIVFRLASGGLGVDRLAHLGVDWLPCAGAAGACCFLPALIVSILVHPGVRAGIAGGFRGLAQRPAQAKAQAAADSAQGVDASDTQGQPDPKKPDKPARAASQKQSSQPAEAPSDTAPTEALTTSPRSARVARIARVYGRDGARVHPKPQAGHPQRNADSTETTPISSLPEDEDHAGTHS